MASTVQPIHQYIFCAVQQNNKSHTPFEWPYFETEFSFETS